MSMRRRLTLILVLGIAALLPLRTVSADAPPPTMTFQFLQGIPGEQLTIVSGTLFECGQPDCRDAKSAEELWGEKLSCADDSCEVMVYPPLAYYRLQIKFSDGKSRQSNIFRAQHWFTTYKVTIRPDDILVELQSQSDYTGGSGFLAPIFAAAPVLFPLCCLIVVAAVVGAILLRRSRKKPK